MQWTSAPNIGEAPLPQRARGYWKARFSAAREELERLLEAERTQLPPWIVIGFGSGIAGWFALDRAAQWQALICVASALALIGFVLASGRAGRALGWFALAAALGCALVWARSVLVAQPPLSHASVAQVQGRAVSDDHLQARGTTRTLIATSTAGLPPKVRLSIDDDKVPVGLAPGAVIDVRARLVPPPPMALPGTYDFARDAWFQSLGAVGKPLGPVTVVKAGQAKGLDRARDGLRTHIEQRLAAGPAGGPGEHERDPDAALVGRALVEPERRVRRPRPARGVVRVDPGSADEVEVTGTSRSQSSGSPM